MILMIGLAFAVLFLFVVLVVLLLLKKRSPNAVQNTASPQIVEVFRPSQHAAMSFRQQMKQEQAEAMASVYADQIEKKFLADTIADAQLKLAAWKPV